MLLKKKWRIVIDFRKINEYMDQDAYPLPAIDDISEMLFRTLDDYLKPINSIMDKLFYDNSKIAQSIANQTIITKNILNSA